MDEFELSKRRTDGITILDLAGRITAGDALASLRSAIPKRSPTAIIEFC